MTEKRMDNIPVELIICDPDFRARDHDDPDHITRLSRTNPTTWPPLVVTQRADGLFALLDGFHRLEAGRKIGLEKFDCEIISPVDNDEYLTAVALNLDGRALPLSLQDRKVFAAYLHQKYPDVSARKIAMQVGLSHSTVSTLMKQENGTNAERGKTRSSINTMLSLMKRIIDTGEGAGFMGLGNRAQFIADRVAGSKDPKLMLKSLKTWAPILEKAIELIG